MISRFLATLFQLPPSDGDISGEDQSNRLACKLILACLITARRLRIFRKTFSRHSNTIPSDSCLSEYYVISLLLACNLPVFYQIIFHSLLVNACMYENETENLYLVNCHCVTVKIFQYHHVPLPNV